jgi:hypothetical protein
MKFSLKTVPPGFLDAVSVINYPKNMEYYTLVRSLTSRKEKTFVFYFDNDVNESFSVTLYLTKVTFRAKPRARGEEILYNYLTTAISFGDLFKLFYYQNRENKERFSPEVDEQFWKTVMKSLTVEQNSDFSNLIGELYYNQIRPWTNRGAENLSQLVNQKLFLVRGYGPRYSFPKSEPRKEMEKYLLDFGKGRLIETILRYFHFGEPIDQYINKKKSVVLTFDEPKSLKEIYEMIKDGGHVDESQLSSLHKLMVGLNKTETKLAEEYPETYLAGTGSIPDIIPLYAYRKLYFSRFDCGRDLSNINSQIDFLKNRGKWDRRYREISQEDKSKPINFHQTFHGCGDKNCEYCREKFKKTYKRKTVRAELREQTAYYYEKNDYDPKDWE